MATILQEVTIGAASCVDIDVGPLKDLLEIDDASLPIDLEARVPAHFLCSSLLAPGEGVSLGFAAYPATSVDDLMGGFEAMPESRLGPLLAEWGVAASSTFDEVASSISVPKFQLALMDYRGLVAETLVATDSEVAYVDASGVLVFTRQYRDAVLMFALTDERPEAIDGVEVLRAAADYLVSVVAE